MPSRPAPLHKTRVLYNGALVCARDVRCSIPASPCGAEESARDHQIIFTRTGAFVKHSAGARREVVAEPLHVLCFNRHETYRISHPGDSGDECTVLSFPARAMLDVATAIDPSIADAPSIPFRISHAPLTTDALLRFRALRRALSANVDALAVEDDALDVLGAVMRDGYRAHGRRPRYRRATTWRDRRDLVERTKETLAARPGDTRSLATLAREVNSSPFHLTRVFRDHVGMPVHRYLVQLRLAIALERMEQGERSLAALGLALGFSSHSHFTTAFRRVYGVAPTAFHRAR